AYLGGMLVLCRTLGALAYGAILMPLVRWAKPRTQLRVAVVLVAITLAYPMLRTEDLVPTTFVVDAAGAVDADRAASLKVRFDNGKMGVGRGGERIWLGWGRWGRNRIYSEEDAGKDMSITDGRWIITLGTFGLFGFFAEFGLLALSVLRMASALRFVETA